MSEAPVLVVGGGHNGLVCATYLAKAGLSVTVLEARDLTGGCASTVDAVGTRVNICNCDHIFVRATSIPEELDLARHGLRYLDLDPYQIAMGWEPEHRPWVHFPSATRTLDGLRRTHPDQVEGYGRYLKAAVPVAGLLVELASAPPTPGRVLRELAARRAAGLRTLMSWSRRPVGAVLRDFFTDDALLAPAVATGPAVWGCSSETPGTGAGAVGYALKHLVPPGRPVGGSGALPTAIRLAFEAHGGVVRTGAEVERLVVDAAGRAGRRAAHGGGDPGPGGGGGVRSARGVPPLVGRRRPRPTRPGLATPTDARRLRVEDRRPHHDACLVIRTLPASLGDADPLRLTAVVAPPVAGIDAAWREAQAGRVAERPILLVNVPSVLDDTMRQGDDHVFSLEVLFTPYALEGGWRGATEPARWLERFASLCEPGFLDGVQEWRVMDPPAYEREFRMPRGWAPSYSGAPLAAFLGRDRELTRYETPVPGLFLTGAGTFPGAGIWGASGRNAAAVVQDRLDHPRHRLRRRRAAALNPRLG